MSSFLYTSANGFKEGPCPASETEQCVRICWKDTCVVGWDLWVRWKQEDGGDDDDSSNKWCSYLNPGPVGALGLELSADSDKPGFEGSLVCDSPAPTCSGIGIAPWAGEMVCWCIEDDSNFPKVIDVVVNLFGADSACSDPLGTVCVEYFCADELTAGKVAPNGTQEITGVSKGSGSGTSGNDGNGDHRQFAILDNGSLCADKAVGSTEQSSRWEFSTCWALSGMQPDGKYFINRGPGRAPKKFIIPDNVDMDSCMLIEDGIEIPKRHYKVMNEAAAKHAGVSISTLEDMGYVKGRKSKGKKKRKGRCTSCGKKKNINLF